MKKIAIIGSGLAGLGVGYYLHEYLPKASITFFDEAGLGGKTSQIASGLLHPYPGKQARPSKEGHIAFEESCHLINVASCYSEEKVADFGPIDKFTSDEDHYLDQYSDVEKIGERHYLIKTGATVYTSRYLKALLASMRRATFVKKKVSLEELSEFDHVVVAGGAGTLAFHLNLPLLRINKGQIVIAKGSLERAILCGGYLVNSETRGLIYVGSTYERDYQSEEADLEKAIELIGEKIIPFYPLFESLEFTGCRAGLRVVSPHHNVPLIKIIDERTSVFTALGSRGLLYHALYGKKLAKALCFGDSILL